MIRRTIAPVAALSVFAIWIFAAGADDGLKRGGMFGARLGPVTDEAHRVQKLDDGGAMVIGVIPGTAAEEAGFKAPVTSSSRRSRAPRSLGPARVPRRDLPPQGRARRRRSAWPAGEEIADPGRSRSSPARASLGNAEYDVVYDSVPEPRRPAPDDRNSTEDAPASPPRST